MMFDAKQMTISRHVDTNTATTATYELTGIQVNTGNDYYRINLFVKFPTEYKIASAILPTDGIQDYQKSDPQL